jgi:hypothetical protein
MKIEDRKEETLECKVSSRRVARHRTWLWRREAAFTDVWRREAAFTDGEP